MAEPTVQVPVSLIERALKVADILYPDGLPVREELRALLSHPTPSAEPVSIADMAPGTTFVARYRAGAFHGDAARWRKVDATLVALASSAGTPVYATQLDPSTIRDVTPPPKTPEAN